MKDEKKDILLFDDLHIDVEEQILEEQRPDELKDLVDIFNVNLKKKSIIRANKLSDVQDKVVEQISKRVEETPDHFSNKDLLEYHKTIESTLSKNDTTLDDVKIPQIQINQQVNITKEDKFDVESRKRIQEAVASILSNSESEQPQVVDTDYEIVDEDEEER